MGILKRRDFIASNIGLAASAFVQGALAEPTAGEAQVERREIPRRLAKTSKLFKAPGAFPNALASMTDAPGGLWIGQQKLSGAAAAQYHVSEPTDLSEAAWLVDMNGKLVTTVETNSRNTSGMAYGNHCIWMLANLPPEGVFQVDMDAKQIAHRQIPLGSPANGGGSHGATWHEGKLWIVANRLRALMRVDPVSWVPEFMIPIYSPPGWPRWHDISFDDKGFLWQVICNDSTGYATGKAGLVKYDPSTGEPLLLVDFVSGSSDPHGLEYLNGAFVSCDAGIHPGWQNNDSPTSGWIFRIDLI